MNQILQMSQKNPSFTLCEIKDIASKEMTKAVLDDEVEKFVLGLGNSDVSISLSLLALDSVIPLSKVTNKLNAFTFEDKQPSRRGVALNVFCSIPRQINLREMKLKETLR